MRFLKKLRRFAGAGEPVGKSLQGQNLDRVPPGRHSVSSLRIQDFRVVGLRHLSCDGENVVLFVDLLRSDCPAFPLTRLSSDPARGSAVKKDAGISHRLAGFTTDLPLE